MSISHFSQLWLWAFIGKIVKLWSVDGRVLCSSYNLCVLTDNERGQYLQQQFWLVTQHTWWLGYMPECCYWSWPGRLSWVGKEVGALRALWFTLAIGWEPSEHKAPGITACLLLHACQPACHHDSAAAGSCLLLDSSPLDFRISFFLVLLWVCHFAQRKEKQKGLFFLSLCIYASCVPTLTWPFPGTLSPCPFPGTLSPTHQLATSSG